MPGLSFQQLQKMGASFSPVQTPTATPPVTSTEMRTDRNNNPTAMTTDVARVLGLKEGQDYVQGDSFDNGKYYTAKLLGDPVATTTKALDTAVQSGKQAFYTDSGQQRWTHTALTNEQWSAMTPDQKKATIGQMYQKEGGSGQLMNGNAPKGKTLQELQQMGASFSGGKSPYSPEAQTQMSNVDQLKQKYGITGDQQPSSQDNGLLSNIGNTIKDVGIGALKGVGSTLSGAAQLGEKGMSAILSSLGLKQPEQTGTEQLGLQQKTEATNTAQTVGKTIEQLAEFLIPGGAAGEVGKAVEGADALTKFPKFAKILGFGSKLATEGLIGAGQQSAQEGKTDNFLGNAMLFGTLGGVGEGVGKLGEAITEKLPGKIVNSVLKPSVKETEKALKYGGETFGEQAVKRGVVGTDKSLFEQATKNMNASEDKLQTILDGSNEVINKTDLYKNISPIIDKLANTPGMAEDFNHVVKVYSEMPQQMTLPEANVIKRNLYKVLNDKAYFLDPNLSTKLETMKAVANGLKTAIEEKSVSTAGEGVVKGINQDLAFNGKLAKKSLKNMAKAENRSVVPSVLGHAKGAVIGGLIAGAPGATAGVIAEDLAKTTIAKTATAQALHKTGEIAKKLPIKKAGKLLQAEIVKKSE